MAAEDKYVPCCQLDSKGCVRLQSILQSFNAPVSEEQAWAVCYQTAKCLLREWEADCTSCYCIADTAQIQIHKDGTVHGMTAQCTDTETETTRTLAKSEYQLVTSLGLAIFHALDYGLCEDEERTLSEPLELLIDKMTSADSDDEESQNGDEGIVRDSGEDDILEGHEKHKNGIMLSTVVEMCSAHLICPVQADVHYKAVCRALVAEGLELSSFLEKIAKGTKELRQSIVEATESDSSLDKLEFQDWARLWMQVIKELRQGVKLKKVDIDSNPHPIEYELTPYEMLLDDIRSRRYKLNKVMVNGDLPPRVKKDAHALILEFIRSRPPLVPVSRRKLPPAPPRQPSLYEKLMASIRQQHKLKPVRLKDDTVETSRTKLQDDDDTPQPRRRLIKADLTLRLSPSFEDDDADDIPSTPFSREPQSLPVGRRNPPVRFSWQTGSPDVGSRSSKLERRHSISVCESPSRPRHPILKQPCNGMLISPAITPEITQFSPSQSAFSNWNYSQLDKSLQCLSLTLDEVVHIRNVLTKAELETYLMTLSHSLYEDIEKGKVCFTCKETRFCFFGPWGVKCNLCARTVCDKCSTKMHIPTDHFANIPVNMLSPTPSPPSEDRQYNTSPFWKLAHFASFSSVPSSPKITQRKNGTHLSLSAPRPSTGNKQGIRHSKSIHIICKEGRSGIRWSPFKRSPLLRSRTIHDDSDASPAEKLRGPLMTVCRECKGMVRHIIIASRSCAAIAQRKRRNSKAWRQKKAVSYAASCMTPLAESPPSSPDGP